MTFSVSALPHAKPSALATADYAHAEHGPSAGLYAGQKLGENFAPGNCATCAALPVYRSSWLSRP